VVRKGATGHWAKDRTQTTIWQIDKPQKSETGHAAQNPVECMKRPIENNSSPGQAVYDPFVGSGTTIIAAEMTAVPCDRDQSGPLRRRGDALAELHGEACAAWSNR
jgi:DNA methylase